MISQTVIAALWATVAIAAPLNPRQGICSADVPCPEGLTCIILPEIGQGSCFDFGVIFPDAAVSERTAAPLESRQHSAIGNDIGSCAEGQVFFRFPEVVPGVTTGYCLPEDILNTRSLPEPALNERTPATLDTRVPSCDDPDFCPADWICIVYPVIVPGEYMSSCIDPAISAPQY